MSLFGGGPKMSAPAPPPPPPAPPTLASPVNSGAGAQQAAAARAAVGAGFAGTLDTSPMGTSGAAPVAKQTLGGS